MEYDRILEDLLQRKDYLVIGRSVTRTDALDKVLGRAKYTVARAYGSRGDLSPPSKATSMCTGYNFPLKAIMKAAERTPTE